MVALAVLLLTLLSCIIAHSLAAKINVKTNAGEVRGREISVLGKNVIEYLGIPFAEPPTGDLRFKRPQKKKNWQNVLDATKQPNTCIGVLDKTFGDTFKGSNMWNTQTTLSEDCLYLNVWRPSAPPAAGTKYPVMVWIFGGGFFSGSITLDLYNGTILAGHYGVILVSMQYRLSSLGFATLGTDELGGNMGLYDQLMALEWVQENIGAFDGDKDKVTIFGESAGAASVNFHLISPLSKGKFKRAILQSSTATCPWATLEKRHAIDRTMRFAKDKNCGRDECNENFRDPKCDTLAKNRIATCLRNLTSDVFKNAEDWIVDGHAQFPFPASIDGEFIPAEPGMMLENRKLEDLEIMLGFNKDEGTFFLLYELLYSGFNTTSVRQQNLGISEEQLRNFLANIVMKYYPYWPQKMSSASMDVALLEYYSWYKPQDEQRNLKLLDQAAGDYNFVCDVLSLADKYSMNFKNKLYLYYFTQRAANHPWPKWGGVMHGDEIPYIFGRALVEDGYSDTDMKVSRAIMTYWTNFAKHGNPNGDGFPNADMKRDNMEGLPQWRTYNTQSYDRMTLSSAMFGDGKNLASPERLARRIQKCALWKEFIPQFEQTIDKYKRQANAPCEKKCDYDRKCNQKRNAPYQPPSSGASQAIAKLPATFIFTYFAYLRCC